MSFKKLTEMYRMYSLLQNVLPRITLVINYKAFVRPHLDHGDILHNQVFNSFFHHRLESI